MKEIPLYLKYETAAIYVIWKFRYLDQRQMVLIPGMSNF